MNKKKIELRPTPIKIKKATEEEKKIFLESCAKLLDRKKWDKWKCPKCKKTVSGYPATSRKDNKKQICSSCGLQEALDNFSKNTGSPKMKVVTNEQIRRR